MQWLADNGSAYTAAETLSFAAALNLVPCFTPVRSPESNGVSEAFVKTLKRDYARVQPRPTPTPFWLGSAPGSPTTTNTIPIVGSACARRASSSVLECNQPRVRFDGGDSS